jgi:acetoacetyl-CoA synthetase
MAVNGVDAESKESVELWRHPNPESTEFYAFQQYVAKKHGVSTSSYHDLWQWSIDHPDAFWEEIWHYTGIKANKQYDVSNNLREHYLSILILLAGCPRHVRSNVP